MDLGQIKHHSNKVALPDYWFEEGACAEFEIFERERELQTREAETKIDPSIEHVCSKYHDKTTTVHHRTAILQPAACDSASY
jgi:hypothetical protein